MKRTHYRDTSIGVLAAVILLLVATSPFWAVMVIRQQATRIVDDSLRGLAASSLATVTMSDGFLEMALALATTDPAVRAKQFEQVDKLTVSTDASLKLYETSVDNAREREDFQRLVEARSEFRQTRQQVIEMLSSGKRDEAVKFYNRVGLPQFVAYKDAINRLVQHNADEARERGTTILRLCNVLLILQGILLVFFFIYAFFVPLVTLYEKLTTTSNSVKDL